MGLALTILMMWTGIILLWIAFHPFSGSSTTDVWNTVKGIFTKA